MRDTFIKTLFSIAKNDANVILVTGDLGFGVLKAFWDELPNQIINVGIAEQNMIGFASGLALQGKIVYVYSIANFPTLRPLEQLRNDVAYHNLNVKIISIGSGFSYGSLGMSHHATEDIGVISSIPNIKIYSPSTIESTQLTAYLSYNEKTPSYIRLGRENTRFQGEGLISNLQPTFVISNSSRNLFITYGDIIDEVLDSIELLREKGIEVDLMLFHILKPLDVSFISRNILLYEKIFIIEEHSTLNALSSLIKANLSIILKPIISIGLSNNSFTTEVGNQAYLRKINGLDKLSIFNTVIKYF